jgi:hypothetical protein
VLLDLLLGQAMPCLLASLAWYTRSAQPRL